MVIKAAVFWQIAHMALQIDRKLQDRFTAVLLLALFPFKGLSFNTLMKKKFRLRMEERFIYWMKAKIRLSLTTWEQTQEPKSQNMWTSSIRLRYLSWRQRTLWGMKIVLWMVKWIDFAWVEATIRYIQNKVWWITTYEESRTTDNWSWKI